MAVSAAGRDAGVMVSVRTRLTHDRHHPTVDRVFDAACDLMITTRALETQSRQPPEAPPSIAATLGVLDASRRTLGGALPHLAARVPAGPTSAETRDAMHRAETALTDAAAACDAARQSVLVTTRRPGAPRRAGGTD